MFARDQKEIGHYAHAGPDQFARVVTFVYLTIQQSIFTVPDMLRDVERQGTESRFLWGFKLNAYEWLNENRQAAYQQAMDAFYSVGDERSAAIEALQTFASWPGLGLIKGGFCNQLIFGVTGCIDSHNLNLYEVEPSRFKASRYKNAAPKTRTRLAHEYHDFCDQIGTDRLWDIWCEHVADQNDTTADAVSRLHVEALQIGE